MTKILPIIIIYFPTLLFGQDPLNKTIVFKDIAEGKLTSKNNTYWFDGEKLGFTSRTYYDCNCFDGNWYIELNIIISDVQQFLNGSPVAVQNDEPGAHYRKVFDGFGGNVDYDRINGTVQLKEKSESYMEIELNFTVTGNDEHLVYNGDQIFTKDY